MPRLEITAPLTLFAPAKLNLGLEVLGRRADGMHEVATILQTVSIFDRIDLLPSDRLRYEPLPGVEREHDLIWRALRAANVHLGIQLAAVVRLRKSIPVAAGLGGGSSDAGTLLGALAGLVRTGASRAEEAAAELGSDVPFFVRGGTAVARGTGTDVRGLPPLPRAWFTVVTPGIGIPDKTRTLYHELRREDMSDGADTERLATLISEGKSLDSGLLRSSFARPLLERDAVRDAVAALQAAGAVVVMPAGAGPSVFAPHGSFDEARRVSAAARGRGFTVRVFTTVRPGLNDGRLAEWRRRAAVSR